MSKIEEIKEKLAVTDEIIDQCMKEYAEYYAKKCLEELERQAVYDFRNDTYIIKDSLTGMKLPEHA
jgi:hypothetical protein